MGIQNCFSNETLKKWMFHERARILQNSENSEGQRLTDLLLMFGEGEKVAVGMVYTSGFGQDKMRGLTLEGK